MRDLGRLIWSVLLVLLRSRAALAAENLVLRQQINVLRRTAPKRPFLSNVDRLIFVCLYRLFPGVRNVLAIVKPETIMRWHRWGFGAYWRWRLRIRGGRPTVPLEIRRLIREISFANRFGVRLGFTESSSSSVSISGRRAWRNTWCGSGDRRLKAGRPSCAIMPMGSPRWISS